LRAIDTPEADAFRWWCRTSMVSPSSSPTGLVRTAKAAEYMSGIKQMRKTDTATLGSIFGFKRSDEIDYSD
jgi:hypothetical protein